MDENQEIVDPTSDNVVRFTDNGLKEGDLPGFEPTGVEPIITEVPQEILEKEGTN